MKTGDLVMWTYPHDGEPVVARILGDVDHTEELPRDSYVTCEIVWAAIRDNNAPESHHMLGTTAQWPLYKLKPVDPVWLGQMYNLTIGLINELEKDYEETAA